VATTSAESPLPSSPSSSSLKPSLAREALALALLHSSSLAAEDATPALSVPLPSFDGSPATPAPAPAPLLLSPGEWAGFAAALSASLSTAYDDLEVRCSALREHICVSCVSAEGDMLAEPASQPASQPSSRAHHHHRVAVRSGCAERPRRRTRLLKRSTRAATGGGLSFPSIDVPPPPPPLPPMVTLAGPHAEAWSTDIPR
jgi:hypothetical protein